MTNIPVPLSTHRYNMNVETSFCFLLSSILCLFILIFCLESMNGTGGGSAELEAMKQDILREMRKEIAKAKLEIIEGGVTWHGSSLTLYTCTSVAFLIPESVDTFSVIFFILPIKVSSLQKRHCFVKSLLMENIFSVIRQEMSRR